MGNKGFTLVELIVATAILGLISLAVAGFMSAGARTYGSLNYTLRLQYQAQLAMSQMQEYVIDCVDGIQWDDTTKILTVVNGDGAEQAVQFVYTAADNTITLQKGEYTADTSTFAGDGTPAVLVEDVDDFVISLTPDATDGTLVQSVTLTLDLARQGKTYTGTQTLALRNRPTDLSTAP